MSDERRVPITLRMPRALLDALKDAADSRSHSMNAEIVQRLEASLTKREVFPKIVPVPTDFRISPEEVEWLGLWGDMTETQRRRALAILKAAISADAA